MTSVSSMKRGYVDGRFGQVHFWQTYSSVEADTDADTGVDARAGQPALYCLHATAYSGRTFHPLMKDMWGKRNLVALDTPGYGASDAPTSEIDMAAYAEALAEAIHAIEALQPNGAKPVDLFGYHTGAMLAAEIAVLYPNLVRRIILIGIPFFTGADKHCWRQKLVHVTQLDESFEQFRQRWEYFIAQRTPGLSLERAFDSFVDELRAYPRDWWAHKALFDYLPETRLPLVQAPVRIINPSGALAEFSRNAVALFQNATIVELPEVGGAPLDLACPILASEIEAFLQALEA